MLLKLIAQQPVALMTVFLALAKEKFICKKMHIILFFIYNVSIFKPLDK
jgi:hypothetical protein